MSMFLVKNDIIIRGDNMNGLGAKIRLAREEWGLSQTEVAKNIPMNQSNYSKIERDLQEPNIEQLSRICVILKLDANYLLETEEFGGITEKDIKLLKDIKLFINNHK